MTPRTTNGMTALTLGQQCCACCSSPIYCCMKGSNIRQEDEIEIPKKKPRHSIHSQTWRYFLHYVRPMYWRSIRGWKHREVPRANPLFTQQHHDGGEPEFIFPKRRGTYCCRDLQNVHSSGPATTRLILTPKTLFAYASNGVYHRRHRGHG